MERHEHSIQIPKRILISKFILFADDILAMKDIWIIGDAYLKCLAYTLKAMKVSSKAQASSSNKPRKEPYIHQQYNVETFYDVEQNVNAMGRIFNSLMKALNDNRRSLPGLIIIIPGREFLEMLNFFDFGVSLMISKCLYWLIRKVDKTVQARHEALIAKKPGSVPDSEPKIVWAQISEHAINHRDRLSIIAAKYNSILNQTLLQTKNGYILYDNRDIAPQIYDHNGNITYEGRIQYWRHINITIQRFDNPEYCDIGLPEKQDDKPAMHRQQDKQNEQQSRKYFYLNPLFRR